MFIRIDKKMCSNLAVIMLAVIVVIYSFDFVLGHGMLMDPPNRSSVWRFYPDFPINYNDNQNFCGGYSVQWDSNEGKCGLCGDDYEDPRPRANENTGIYGLGKIVAKYNAGDVITTTPIITANHLGYFKYSLCCLEDPSKPEPDDCFKDLLFEDGSDKYYLGTATGPVTNKVKLPNDLTCKNAVLRWHYTTGNFWGSCGNGTSALGCGPQESFMSCSDVVIV